jgi:NAD(P) transhydrogenase subunit alpha
MTPLIDDKEKALKVNWQDELVTGTLVCRDGVLVHPRLTGAGGK